MLPSGRSISLLVCSIIITISLASAAATSEGCFAGDSSLSTPVTYDYQSQGYCMGVCVAGNYAVFAMTNGNGCSCGNSLPSTTSNSCNLPCTGYPSDICGGTNAYSVWLTGVGSLSGGSGLAAAAPSSAVKKTTSTTTAGTSTSTSTTAPIAPTVIYVTTAVVQQGVTVIQTVSASTRPSTPSASASSATQQRASNGTKSGISGGAIAGIVIGVLALLAIGAIIAFLMLRRRKKQAEDFGEYKKHIEPAGAGVTRQPSSLDNRLDTSLAVRRDSAESLADNQDYSRKILRVVN